MAIGDATSSTAAKNLFFFSAAWACGIFHLERKCKSGSVPAFRRFFPFLRFRFTKRWGDTLNRRQRQCRESCTCIRRACRGWNETNNEQSIREDYMPLMDRTERRLTATSAFLTQAGRLQLVNSVLSSLPTYTMCSLKIPIAVLGFIDRARKHCL